MLISDHSITKEMDEKKNTLLLLQAKDRQLQQEINILHSEIKALLLDR